MIGSIHQNCLQANHWEACQNTLLNAFLQAFFHCREEILRYSSTEYTFFKYQFIGKTRFKFNPNIAILSMPAGLLLIFALYFYLFPNGFPVSNLWCSQGNNYAKIVLQSGCNSKQMLFAQARQQHLSCIWILYIGKGLIFLQQLLHCYR